MEGVNRGDVVLAATAGDYGKPRPWLVVQTDGYNHSARPQHAPVQFSRAHSRRMGSPRPIEFPWTYHQATPNVALG